MKKVWLLWSVLLLPACNHSQKDKLWQAGEIALKAHVYVRDEKSRRGVMLIKDWQNRALVGYEVALSCVTPGLPSMPNPMSSIGSYQKPDGGRCYVYIQQEIELKNLELEGIEVYKIEKNQHDTDFSPDKITLVVSDSEDSA